MIGFYHSLLSVIVLARKKNGKLKDTYKQMEVAEKEHDKTAFCTPFGLFEYS